MKVHRPRLLAVSRFSRRYLLDVRGDHLSGKPGMLEFYGCQGIDKMSGKVVGMNLIKANCRLLTSSLEIHHCLVDFCGFVLPLLTDFSVYQIILNIDIYSAVMA